MKRKYLVLKKPFLKKPNKKEKKVQQSSCVLDSLTVDLCIIQKEEEKKQQEIIQISPQTQEKIIF